MNEGIHLDLDTWIVPGQIRKAILCRGLGNRYTPAGTEVLISAVAHTTPPPLQAAQNATTVHTVHMNYAFLLHTHGHAHLHHWTHLTAAPVSPSPEESIILHASSCTLQVIPAVPSLLLPTAPKVPATKVPWPLSSIAARPTCMHTVSVACLGSGHSLAE